MGAAFPFSGSQGTVHTCITTMFHWQNYAFFSFQWSAHTSCKVCPQWSAYLSNGCLQHSVSLYCCEPHVFSTNRWVSSEPCESLCQQWWAGNEFAWDRALRWAALNQVKMPDTCMYCGFSVQNTRGEKKEGFQFMATTLIPNTYDWVYLHTSIVERPPVGALQHYNQQFRDTCIC